MGMEHSVMRKILINLGEEGKGLTSVYEVHKLQHFYKMLETFQRKSESLGGSQQALVHSKETRAMAVALH